MTIHRPDVRPAVEGMPRRDRWAWFRAALAVPAAILPLLPSAPCPLCVAAYTSVLSALGVGFLLYDRVQRPFIVLLLSFTLASVGWTAARRRRPGPFLLALAGSVGIITARLIWKMPFLAYAGAACLLVAAAWNIALKLRAKPTLVQVDIAETE